MKKNIIKISVIGIIILGVIGIGTYFAMNKEESTVPEVEVREEPIETEWIVPEAKEASKPEILEPEVEVIEEETVEAVDVVENTEEKPSGRKLSVYDAKKFLKERNSFDTVKVSAEPTEKVEEVVEVESNNTSTSNVEAAHKASESSLTGAGYYDAAKDFSKDDFASYPISCTDLKNNPTLIALQAEVNPIIDNDGGCNEGFILRSNEAIISYVGESYFVDAKILVDGNLQTTVSINCHLNDVSWRCISTTLEEIYPNLGASLSGEMRKACEVGSDLYGNFNTWNTYNGIHTKVILAENGDSLVFVLR